MDTSRVIPVICLALFLAAGIPAALYVALRRDRGGVGQVELFRRAAHRARQPWSEEDENLQELSRRVAALKKEDPEAAIRRSDDPNKPRSGSDKPNG